MKIDEQLMVGLMAYFSILIALALVFTIIMIVAMWRIFTKAGEAGWKSIIPFYNMYTQYKICWNVTMFWVLMGAIVVSVIGSLVLPLISTICSMAMTVIGIVAAHKLSKAFGHGVGFSIGLIFLNPIFIMILAFGSSQYRGPQ